jgi:hypothetical protein
MKSLELRGPVSREKRIQQRIAGEYIEEHADYPFCLELAKPLE